MIRVIVIIGLLFVISFFDCQAQITDFTSVDFRRADENAFRYPDHSLKNLKSLADKLTAGLPTEVEKFRALYRWVCDNIAYDYVLYQRNQRYRSKKSLNPKEEAMTRKNFQTEVFDLLGEKRRTVCTGYAYLLRELAKHAGIECVIVDGYGRTAQSNIGGNGVPNHSWNAVMLEGKWYLCDPTWASGAVEDRFHQFIKKYDDVYFLSDPALFIKNHYPLDPKWTLLNEAPTLNEFLNRPLIYSNAYRYQIRNAHPTKFDVNVSKGDELSFRFESKCELQNAKLVIDGVSTDNIFERDHEHYAMSRAFKSKGVHIIHLLVDDHSVLTYRVKVN